MHCGQIFISDIYKKILLHAATWLSKHAVKTIDLPWKLSERYTDLLSAAITILNHMIIFLIDTLAWIEYCGISNTILIAAKAIAAYTYITLKGLTK